MPREKNPDIVQAQAWIMALVIPVPSGGGTSTSGKRRARTATSCGVPKSGRRGDQSPAKLHEFLLTSVCTGSWIYGHMGLLDGLHATNRKEPDRLEGSNLGKVPLDRLAEIAPAAHISRARVVDTGRIVTAGGISSGMEMAFYLLHRAGYDENFLSDVARTMEYSKAYAIYRDDIEEA